jgi:hypothetical protein
VCSAAGYGRADALGLITNVATFMTTHCHTETLERIQSALQVARMVFQRFTVGTIAVEYKASTILLREPIARWIA